MTKSIRGREIDRIFAHGKCKNTVNFVLYKGNCMNEANKYHLRHVQERVRLLSQYFKIVLITGARQVGKTTLLKQSIFVRLFWIRCNMFPSCCLR